MLAAEAHSHLVCNMHVQLLRSARHALIVCLRVLAGPSLTLVLRRWWLAMWKRATRYLTCLASSLFKKTEPGQIIYVVAMALARTLTPMFRTLRAHTAVRFSRSCVTHSVCLSKF
jgi:hypothetical protein